MKSSIAEALIGLVLVIALGACKTTNPVDQGGLRAELERAVLDDQGELREDSQGDEHFQAFMKKYGEDAVPVFEKLVVEAADSGGNDNANLVNAAVVGLVALQRERARGMLEKLASSKKAELLFSQIALNALVDLASESEKVGLLIARLREGRHPEDQQWAVGRLITLGRAEAVPDLKELRTGISNVRTL